MKYQLISLVLVLFNLLQPLQAAVVEDLYTIEVPIANQTTSLRLEAFAQAFDQVVVKVSGSDDALKSAAFKRPRQRSARYVKQFRYISQESEDEFESQQLFLRIDFDQSLIESLLRESNFPIWGRERPRSLLVVSYDVNETIQIVSSDTTPEIIELFDTVAIQLGLPVLFPLMDLEDIALVSIADIVSRQFDSIDTMAERYAPDAMVVGQIVGRSGKGWYGDWEVRFSDQIFKWKFNASSKQAVIQQSVRHLARVLALEYALEDHRLIDDSLELKVSSVSDIEDLIAVKRYLESLNVVELVRIVLVSSDEVTYQLKLRNKAEDLQRLIEFGEVLEQQELPLVHAGENDNIILHYRYISLAGGAR